MALNFESKKVIVDQVGTTASNALSLVIADARGVNVTHMTILREKAREQNIEIRVVRNTLAKLAFKGTDFECVSEVLTGPSLFGFSMEDPGAAARLFKEFAKDNDKFEVKALSISGQLLDNGKIDVLAKLPTLEQALGQLACVTLAPITKLVRTFNEVPTKVTRVVGAVRDKKQEAA